jgi:hypothetical protein
MTLADALEAKLDFTSYVARRKHDIGAATSKLTD